MDFSLFIFAFMVFILAVMIALLIKRLKGDDAKILKELEEREKKIFKLYQNLEDLITEAEDYIYDAKRDILADKKHMSAMLKDAEEIRTETKREAESLTRNRKVTNISLLQNKTNAKKGIKTVPSQGFVRKEQVLRLKSQGMKVEDISKELEMSQGEVNLIIKLVK